MRCLSRLCSAPSELPSGVLRPTPQAQIEFFSDLEDLRQMYPIEREFEQGWLAWDAKVSTQLSD